MAHPKQQRLEELCRQLAPALDEMLQDMDGRRVGFTLQLFDLDDDAGFLAYISNAQRADILKVFREQVKRFESGEG